MKQRKYGKRRSRFKVHRPSGKAKHIRNRRRAHALHLTNQPRSQTYRHGPRGGFYAGRGTR